MTVLRVVDLSTLRRATPVPPGVIVAVGRLQSQANLGSTAATFTLTEEPCADRRVVTVDSVPDTLAELRHAANAGRMPARCATTCCARSTPTARRWPG